MKKFLLAAATLLFGLGASAQESKNGTYYQEGEDWYYMIEDFEGASVGGAGTVVGGNGTAIVQNDPDATRGKSLLFTSSQQNSNEYIKISVTLPQGVTLNNFTDFVLDLKYVESETHKDIYVKLNGTNGTQWDDIQNGGSVITTWQSKGVSISGKTTSDNTFDIYIGGTNAYPRIIYYIDNIRLKYDGTPTPPTPVAVEGVALDKTTAEVAVGKTFTLSPVFTPANATNKNVTWSSDATGVAAVDENGVVTGVSEGTATITAKTDDGGFQATCNVTVTAFVSKSKNGQLVMGENYLMLEDFEDGIIGTDVYIVENSANGATAQIAADPKGVSDNALCFHNINYEGTNNNCYMKFDLTLPDGKKLSDYKAVAFDLFNGEGYGDNGWKKAFVYVDAKDDAHKLFEGNLMEGKSANWLVKEYSLEGKDSDSNKFTLYIGGIHAEDMRIFIDNIRLKQDSEYQQIGSSDTYWKYDAGTTTLTIIGEGPMPDFEGGFWNTPYKQGEGACQMTNLVIGEGITAIGNYCFSDCQQVSNVTFPSTLTRIGNNAFKNCVQLDNLNIPATIEVIGDNAFNMPNWIWTDRTYILNSIPTFGENSFKFEKPEDPEKPEYKATVKLVLDDAVKPFIAATDANMPEIASAEYKRDVTAAYSTICLPFNATIPGGVTVYEMSDASVESITLTAAQSIVAGTPYVVATANLDITEAAPTISVATTPAGDSSMKFIGVMKKKELVYPEAHAYGLFEGKLYLNEGTMTVNPMRAYFESTATETPAREMSLLFGGEVTSINNVAVSTDIVEVYNVNGARQPGLAKGINLVKTANGKTMKVIVK